MDNGFKIVQNQKSKIKNKKHIFNIQKRFWLFALCFSSFIFDFSFFPRLHGSAFASSQCVDWPKVFAQQKVDEAVRKKEIISVGPFLNDTGQPADDWVGQGIADLLIRYLKTDPHLGVLTRADSRLLPPEHPAQYRVEGMYQNIRGWLRGFIQLQDGKGKLLAQFVVETPFPGHKDFFVDRGEAAEVI